MFKPKFQFNPRNKDAAIELYLRSLEERLMKVEVPKDKFSNLTNSERKALYDLKNAPLLKTINGVIAEKRKLGGLKSHNLDYFIMKVPKFARFYLLPKIHERLHNVPGRPKISTSGYYTETIS